MRSTMRQLARTTVVGSLAAGLAVPLSFGAAASAAPPGAEPFTLTCGSTTYEITSNGNGEWTPAQDTRSTLVFVPHAFGTFHGVVYDEQGAVVDEFTEDGNVQGSGKQKSDVTCTYSFHEVADGSDPDFPAGYSFEGSGTVTGKIAGHA